jgi:hypothetical protein
MKHDQKILHERLARIASFQQRGGKMGSVSPALAQWLLGVCRQRIEQLLSSGRLDSFGEGGFRLVPLRSVLEFAKASRKRKCKKVLLRRASKVPGKVRRPGVLQTTEG